MAAKITVNNNGNLRIEGEFDLFDAAGNKYDLAGRTTISLCRCGQSNKKPFCDGSHRASGFASECQAYTLELPKPKP
ncbi:MAG: CDGSH iron-sulfur domain-containing protein [Bacteroidota bacterium]